MLFALKEMKMTKEKGKKCKLVRARHPHNINANTEIELEQRKALCAWGEDEKKTQKPIKKTCLLFHFAFNDNSHFLCSFSSLFFSSFSFY